MKKTIAPLLTSIYLLASAPSQVFAASPGAGGTVDITIPKPSGIQIMNLGKLISSLITFFLFICGLVAFVYLLWGGFQWITSGGDKGNVEAARNKIQAALLGLLIVFAAYAIFTFVGDFLGVGSIFNGGLKIDKPF